VRIEFSKEEEFRIQDMQNRKSNYRQSVQNEVQRNTGSEI